MLARQEDGTIELQAYQPNKKSIAWTKSLEDKTAIFAGNKIMNGILYIGNQSGTLFAIHAKDGSELWRLDTRQEIRSDVFFNGNTLYFTTKDSTCYAVNKTNGKVLWKHQGVFTRKTTFPSESMLFTHIDGKIGYFGNSFEPFTLLDAATGNVYWEYPYSSDAIQSYADIASKNLDVPNWDRSCPKWVISSFEKPFAVKDKLVLLFTSNFRQDLHVLNPSSKKVIWQKDEIEFCLKTDDEKMVVGRYELNKDNNRYVAMLEKLDPETGKVVWRNDKFAEVVNKEGIHFDFDEAHIINKYILINENYGENLFLIDTTNGDLVWAYSSNDNSLNFVNISVYDNVFFVEQLKSNSLFCFQILN
ncbi:MAG: PQQ-binding-like beta-propeller repeat protein [Caldisericia bacterium]|nr:PQQ-binding-like beta-propeller repeat protein [Caldisericia bacterium]